MYLPSITVFRYVFTQVSATSLILMTRYSFPCIQYDSTVRYQTKEDALTQPKPGLSICRPKIKKMATVRIT